ncbi:MAG: UDP-N-acetylmuramoyl-tripeptide--D-alanyl-D-alanine ligase [Gallionellaceae bacterium]|nr:UDP-N-acetylmuramoyl-tripeptide--D-alanyl-D-alanine ligase [Gallionellaceae bacterium]
MRLHEAASALQASAVGPDVEFTVVSTDSRSLPAGALFVALRGDRFDGHAYAAKVLEQGAAAVMVETSAGLDVAPAIVVKDSRLALGQLAAWHRMALPARVVAITGSNGKTTVKEMLAAILNGHAGEAAVLATRGNFNNEIGMPLTLLRLTPEHRYAVLEMGMNHPGELTYLSRLARPDVALVNNALRAHLEGLGTVEAVAHAKGEIYLGLRHDGIALINADDPHADLWRGMADGRRIVSFGVERGDVRADYRLLESGAELTLHTPAGDVQAVLNVPGLHNVRNAVAAAACAWVMDVPLAGIAKGLAEFSGVKGRLQAHPCILGARLIDDTYNANPDSVAAAIAVLAARKGRRILVLGDMGELGPESSGLHREIGATARQAGIDRLLCLGEQTVQTVAAFGPGAMHFERIEELLAEIEVALAPEVTVLVKGSRFMKMERVVQSFIESQACS